MNTPTPYELILSEKLQNLPVPDMADAIWARIEQQLDLDMPTDDPDGNPPAPTSPSGGWKLPLVSASILLIAAIAYLLIAKKPESPIPVNKETPQQGRSVADTIVLVPDLSQPDPVEKQMASPQTSFPILPETSPVTDTGQRMVFSPRKQDTLPLISAPPLLNRPAADSPKTKRPRGVSGLSDADYKIAPAKKDS